MRAIVQRVRECRVEVKGRVTGAIGPGLLIFLGVGTQDGPEDGSYLADKIAHLRIFADDRGAMNRSVMDVGGEVLVVSQFTLWGDCRKGRRPSFVRAARPEPARTLYEAFIEDLAATGLHVETGEFQEMMDVHLINDGPVTLMLDSERQF